MNAPAQSAQTCTLESLVPLGKGSLALESLVVDVSSGIHGVDSRQVIDQELKAFLVTVPG